MKAALLFSWATFVASMPVAHALSTPGLSPKEVYKKAGPAVVLILGSDGSGKGSGGTGSVVTGDGKVVTNAHVVTNAAGKPYKTLYVFLKPPKVTGDPKRDLVNRYPAKVVAVSPQDELDLALLQIQNPPPNLPTIPFADPETVEIGDTVVAIGHPEQGGLWTLTTGAVSTVIANFERVRGKHVFQTEASVNRGNSGGPLLDNYGQMIGVNTAIARKSADGVAITDVNFSLKSSVAVTWLAGQGMGIAYAKRDSDQVVVALAPASDATKNSPKEGPVAAAPGSAGTSPSKDVPQNSRSEGPKEEPPADTLVVNEPPPKNAEVLREKGKSLGRGKKKQKVEAGRLLDPKKAKPKYHTERRPIDLDRLRKNQMKDLENMMKDMRGKVSSKKRKGLGLW